MPADTTVLDIAKDIYKGDYDALSQENWLLSQLEMSTDVADGLRAKHNVHLRRTSGIGGMTENGDLPTAGNQGYKTLTVPLRMLAGRIQVSHTTMKLLGADDAAFVNAADKELEGNKNDLLRDLSRQVWGTSNGVIATCGTTSSSTTVQLLATATSAVQMRHAWFDGGMVIDIGTVANPVAVATGRAVTDFNETNKTITISGAAVSTTSGTHFIFRKGNGGASSHTGLFGDGQIEVTGMQTIVSNTATLHTVTVASEPQWKAQVFANGGTLRDPSEHIINNAITKTAIATGKNAEYLVCSEEVHMAISNLFLSLKRVQNTVELKGGYSGIAWATPGMNGRTGSNISAIVADQDCPAGELFGFCSDSLVWYQHPDGFEWMGADGSTMSRVANKAAYESAIVGYVELAAVRRRDMFRISDLAGVTS